MMFALSYMGLGRQISGENLYFCVSMYYEEKNQHLRICYRCLEISYLLKVISEVNSNLGRGVECGKRV